MMRYTALCKIIELGSFTKAADALGYTQAAVSQMIRSLESEFKLQLIIRMRNGIKLTPEGEKIYPMIHKIVAENKQLHNKVNELSALGSGEIRIGTFTSISRNLLPSLIKKYSKIYPDIKFTIRQGDSAAIMEMLQLGEIDFGFVYSESFKGGSVESFAEDTFCAVLSEDHALAGKGELTLASLAEEDIITLDEGKNSTAEEAFKSAGYEPNIKYIVQDEHTVLAMVSEGLGVGILPAANLSHINYRFNAIPISPRISKKIGIAYSRESLPIAAQRFISFIRDHASECSESSYKFQ